MCLCVSIVPVYMSLCGSVSVSVGLCVPEYLCLCHGVTEVTVSLSFLVCQWASLYGHLCACLCTHPLLTFAFAGRYDSFWNSELLLLFLPHGPWARTRSHMLSLLVESRLCGEGARVRGRWG